MHINLEPRQTDAYTTEATEVLYGGAAGGGKSFYLRVSAIRWCLEVPGIQVYLFRRTLTDLRDNHLRGPTSFFVLLADGIERKQIRYRAVENEFEFPGNSTLHLCYCDSENDVEKYRGAEMHVLILDELTHFSEYQYRFLRSRVRRAGLKVPDGYRARLPRIEAGSNPGSIGHAWVKRSFISPKPPMEKWKTPPEEGGMLRQFIPAKLSDNPHLTNDDPEYANRLKGLGADSLVRAMLDGDWDIVAGQAFEKLRPETHRLEPFDIPKDWLRFGSLDWGSTRPFSYGMWTICGEDTTVDKIKVQRGAMIRYDEWYGWNGTPNEGIRMEAGEVARGILDREDGARMAYRIADSSMWKVDGGPSIAETFNKYGCVLRPSSKGPGSRHAGYVEVRQRIAGNDDGPMLFATKNCHAGFWRTMPDLVMDEHRFGLKSEQIDTDQEDHCFTSDTLVRCYNGNQRIGDLVGTEGFVFTQTGQFEAYKACRLTRRDATIVELVFSDASVVRCTPDHRFMNWSGEWIRAEQLNGQMCPSFYRKPSSHFLASHITGVVSIFSAKVSDCIKWFGSTTTENSRRGSTSTISTQTKPIITRKTLKNSVFPSTLLSITKTLQGWLPHYGLLKKSERKQSSGTVAQKVSSGTRSSMPNIAALHYSRSFLLPAFSAAASSPLALAGNTAQINVGLHTGVNPVSIKSNGNALTAKPSFLQTVIQKLKHVLVNAGQSKADWREVTCISVRSAGKSDVYCMTVPKTSSFCLANGQVVSNCSDDVMYACSSRPWLRNVKPDALKKRDWLFDQREVEEDTWRTA